MSRIYYEPRPFGDTTLYEAVESDPDREYYNVYFNSCTLHSVNTTITDECETLEEAIAAAKNYINKYEKTKTMFVSHVKEWGEEREETAVAEYCFDEEKNKAVEA